MISKFEELATKLIISPYVNNELNSEQGVSLLPGDDESKAQFKGDIRRMNLIVHTVALVAVSAVALCFSKTVCVGALLGYVFSRFTPRDGMLAATAAIALRYVTRLVCYVVQVEFMGQRVLLVGGYDVEDVEAVVLAGPDVRLFPSKFEQLAGRFANRFPGNGDDGFDGDFRKKYFVCLFECCQDAGMRMLGAAAGGVALPLLSRASGALFGAVIGR
jgi:hypothetical protein